MESRLVRGLIEPTEPPDAPSTLRFGFNHTARKGNGIILTFPGSASCRSIVFATSNGRRAEYSSE